MEHRDVDIQRRDVDFNHSLEYRDVDIQRRDVDFNHSLERRDVDIQRRDVDFAPLWNVATLILHLSGTSRR